MLSIENLQNHFLIATPDIDDDYFERSVIYLCEHTASGAMGLVISSPTDLSVMELQLRMSFMMAEGSPYKKDQMVLSGGPMRAEHGFILHTPTKQPFQHSYPISDRIILTTSSDILDTLGTDKAPEHFLICLGCATWSAGQLEEEIAQNAWLIAPCDETILFETGYLDRWTQANALIGVTELMSRSQRSWGDN